MGTNVNTKNEKKQNGAVIGTFATVSTFDQIRIQANEIETRAYEVEILMQTIFEKIDSGLSDPVKTLDAINCYATCALRNVALIKEHNLHILALAGKGGAQ